MTPRDFTPQEELVAECLDEMGLRYLQQVEIGKYTVDFLLENNIVLEADGVFGHYRKSDRERDSELLNCDDILSVVHITEQEKEGIKNQIMEALKCRE